MPIGKSGPVWIDSSWWTYRAMVQQWVIRSILPGRPIGLFLVPGSAVQLVYVLSYLWDGKYKITLAANQQE